jgi:hypothetical protein
MWHDRRRPIVQPQGERHRFSPRLDGFLALAALRQQAHIGLLGAQPLLVIRRERHQLARVLQAGLPEVEVPQHAHAVAQGIEALRGHASGGKGLGGPQ